MCAGSGVADRTWDFSLILSGRVGNVLPGFEGTRGGVTGSRIRPSAAAGALSHEGAAAGWFSWAGILG